MRTAHLVGPLIIVALASACDLDESIRATSRYSHAEDLGEHAATKRADLREEALAAFERDARRREDRFREAAQPGFLFAASRPEEDEIEEGVFSSDELYALGAQLFHHPFTLDEGLGGRDAPYPRRFQSGFRGGPEALSCSQCHWRGGVAGGGDAADNAYLQGDGDTQSSAFERNPPSLAGAGFVELLGREMTAELLGQRTELFAQARASGRPARGELTAKGLAFGALTVRPDGSADPSELTGVGADLVVRPFGRKGTFASLRDVVEDELATHHGMQSAYLVMRQADLPAHVGPFGGRDPDGDGVEDEINEGQVTVLTLFAAMQAPPIVEMPQTPFAPVSLWAAGRNAFDAVGCSTCHTPSLALATTTYALSSRIDGVDVALDLLDAGAEPRLTRDELTGTVLVPLLSDLRRHDMGDALADARDDRGVDRRRFVTPPLWGLARSRPYLHDGRAPTLHDAIMAHGGEAQSSRDAYAALGEVGQAPIRVFLVSQARDPRYVAH